MVALMFLHYSVNISLEHLVLPSGPTAGAIPDPQTVFYGTHLTLGAGLAALFGAAGFLAQGRSTRATVPMLWAASAVFVPLAILIALYYRIYKFEQSMPFAGIALLLAALFAIATEMLSRREPRPGSAAAAAIFATGAVAGAGARAHHGAGERLAYRRARADGAGHRLGRRQAPAAGAARPGRRAGRRRAGAHRLGAGASSG